MNCRCSLLEFSIIMDCNLYCLFTAGYQAIPQPAQMRQTRPTAAPAPGAQAQVRPANMNARPITGQSAAQPRAGMAMPQSAGIPGRAPPQAQGPNVAPQGARAAYQGYPKPMPAQVIRRFIGRIITFFHPNILYVNNKAASCVWKYSKRKAIQKLKIVTENTKFSTQQRTCSCKITGPIGNFQFLEPCSEGTFGIEIASQV